MQLNFRKTTVVILGLLAGGQLHAQTSDTTQSAKNMDYVKPFSGGDAYRTWSIGVNGGVLTPFTIFGSNSKQDFTSPDAKFGYGAYVKKQILPALGLQADFFAGNLQGDQSQPNTFGVEPYKQFETRINYTASLSANFTLANINWRHKKGFIQPYVTLGGGIIGYTPVLHAADGTVYNYTASDNGHIRQFFIPAGLGVKFGLSQSLNLDLGYRVNFVYSDNLDGYNYGSTNDKFSYAHIGLEFAIGRHSKPQMARHNPVSSMRTEYLSQDEQLRNSLETQQKQLDDERAKNDQLNSELNSTNANLAKLTTDSDGDGVADYYDKCPNTPEGTRVDGAGCPLPVAKTEKIYVNDEDRKVVKEAIANLEFDSGKATIREHSLPSLDKVAQLLIDKNFSLKLAGHTDNVGSDAANMKMSKERAEAIKSYLVSKGVNASRIEATGYGKTQPIASNKTAAGRQANRRVEFTLY